MPDVGHGGQPEIESRAFELPEIILQLDRSGNEQPLQFPAVIRNLGTGFVTLEVINPWAIMNWETLKGQKGCLRLQSPETGEFTEIRGTVTWAKYIVQEQDSGLLNLGLELADHDQSVKNLLFEQISYSKDDIKGLWNRWDQARQSPQSKPFSAKIGFAAAIALLLSGLALQLAGPKGFRVFGWVLWFFGTLVVAGQALRYWRSLKASR